MNSISVNKYKDYKYLVFCEKVKNKSHDTNVVVFGYNTLQAAKRCLTRCRLNSKCINTWIE